MKKILIAVFLFLFLVAPCFGSEFSKTLKSFITSAYRVGFQIGSCDSVVEYWLNEGIDDEISEELSLLAYNACEIGRRDSITGGFSLPYLLDGINQKKLKKEEF